MKASPCLVRFVYNKFMWFFVKKGIAVSGVAGICLGFAYLVESYYVQGETKLVDLMLVPVDFVNKIFA